MASRVNVRFVVILAGTLGLLFAGVAAVALYVTLKSAAQNVTLGDKRYAEGDYEAASKFYSTAVAKEPTNLGYIEKWRDALTKTNPDTQVKYKDSYQMLVGGIDRTVARLKKNDITAHRTFLNELYEQSTIDFNRQLWESVRDESTGALAYFEREPPERTDWHTLRRYRGVANLNIMLAGLPLSREDKALAKEDLEAAIKADPSDSQAVVWLSMWHQKSAIDAKANYDEELAAAEAALTDKVLADGAASLPGDPRIEVARLRREVEAALRAVDAGKDRALATKTALENLDALRPRLQASYEVLSKASPDRMPLEVVSQFTNQAMRIDGEKAPAMIIALLDTVIRNHPEDADGLLVKASFMDRTGDQVGALETYQRVAELKTKPICLSGLRLLELRSVAVYQQALVSLKMLQAVKAEDKDGRKAAMDRVKDYRQRLAGLMAERAPMMLILDAKIKGYEGDIGAAKRLLVDYNKATDNRDPEGLGMLANIAVGENELGLAQTQYELLLKQEPNALGAKLRLAQIKDQLKDYLGAKDLAEQVLSVDPQNELALEFLNRLKAKMGDFSGLKDPVMRLLAQAQIVMQPSNDKLPDYSKAAAMLEDGLASFKGTANQDDARVYESLIGCYMRQDNKEAAIDAIKRAQAVHPNHQKIRSLAERLDAQGSLEKTVELIERSDFAEVDKLILKFREYTRWDKKPEADAILATLRQSHLNNAQVVDLLFSVALDRDDIAGAQQLEQRAKEMDVDRCDGLTFVARRQRAEGNLRDAATTMQRAVAKGTANSAMYRLLGILLLDAGQPSDALSAFESGLKISPSDGETAKMYLRALIQMDRPVEALGVARRNEALLKNDPEFREMWLALESSIGNKAFARDRRVELFQRNPKDKNNAAALAAILIQLADWERSRALIDQLRQQGDDLRLVGLDAQWHAERGDLKAAADVYMAYINGLRRPDQPESPDAYISFGQFLISRGQLDQGLVVLTKAAEFQDPKTMRADIVKADMLYRSARFDESAELFKKVLDAGVPDESLAIRKRLIDALIHAERWADAEAAIKGAGAAADTEMDLISSRSQAAMGAGDAARARRILDDAIAKNPSDPLPLYRRARLSYSNKAMTKDAMADLDAAIKLRPSYTPALLLRSALRMNEGRVDDAIKDLHEAADSAPGLDELRDRLLRELLKREREDEAVGVADAALATRPTDLRLMVRLGDIFEANNKSARAVKYFQQAFTQARDPIVASRLVRSLLRVTPLNVQAVEAVLAAMAGQIEQSPDLLMARATLRVKQGRAELAGQDVNAAYNLAARYGPQGAFAWLDQLKEVVPDADQRLKFLRQLSSQASQPAQKELLDLCVTRIYFENIDARSDGFKLLEKLAAGSQDKNLKIVAYRLLLTEHFVDKNYEGAVKAAQGALAITPDEWDLNNNVAALLAENLDRPQDALPYAEKAVKANPNSANVLDTLGTVYKKLGDLPKAEETLQRGLKQAVIPADKATLLLRLGELKAQLKDYKAAAEYADKVRELLADNPDLMNAETEKKLGDLQKSITPPR